MNWTKHLLHCAQFINIEEIGEKTRQTATIVLSINYRGNVKEVLNGSPIDWETNKTPRLRGLIF